MPGCTPSPEADYSVSERTGMVCGEDHSYSESTPNSSIALQGPAETDEFSVTRSFTVSLSPLRGDSKFSMKVQLPPKSRANLAWWAELTLEEMGTAMIPPTQP